MKKQILVKEGHSMDFTTRIQYATDGVRYFSRMQYRDPRYGYKWSAWSPCSELSFKDAPGQGEARNYRLPKVAA